MSTSCQEIATVTGLAQDGRAIVQVRRAEACSSCSARGACQTLGGKTQDITLTLKNSLGARPGDQVVLSLPESRVVQASAVLYLFPALGLICGALLGWFFAADSGRESDPPSIIGSFVGLGLGLGLTRLVGNQMSKGEGYLPRLTAIKSRADSD